MNSFRVPYRIPIKQSLQSLLVLTFLFCIGFIPLQAQDLDVPYVPTPQPVVEKMLDMAEVQPGDYVIDLGSGDGRIVIAAVKRGANGHGIDLDPERIKEARENAEDEGVDDRVMFLKQNIFETDFSRASVITMYLLNSVNKKLRPQLLEELEPGTRVVSHSFSMGDWEADRKAEVSSETGGRTHTIYYWVIPARIEGDWSWTTDGQQFSLSASQTYQEPQIDLSGWQTSEAAIYGKRFSFTATNGNTTHIYSGRVEGDEISGIVQIYEGDEHSLDTWTATRN